MLKTDGKTNGNRPERAFVPEAEERQFATGQTNTQEGKKRTGKPVGKSYGRQPPAKGGKGMAQRTSEIKRKTAETEIFLSLDLDGDGAGGMDSGIGFLNHMLELFKVHSGINLSVVCHGDTEVDAHHSAEDIAIVFGEAFREALGTRKGIERFADCVVPMDETAALVAVDLSGRGYLSYDCPELSDGKCGDFDTELVEEFLRAFCYRAGVNAYVKMLKGGNRHHQAEAVFKGLARCMKKAAAVTSSRMPSSKGVLE